VTEQSRKKKKSKIFSNVALRMLEKQIRNQRMKSITEISKPNRTSAAATTGRLFFLEASGGRIHSANADGSDRKVIVTGCRVPDGIVVDLEAGNIYWTNMGIPSRNDGSIERADLDGKNRVTIIGEGETFTPKQLHLERKSGKLYWCDREGMRVMRSNLDGSKIETLVDTRVRWNHRRSRSWANLLDAKRTGRCGKGSPLSHEDRHPQG
jgi:hypothetical protein